MEIPCFSVLAFFLVHLAYVWLLWCFARVVILFVSQRCCHLDSKGSSLFSGRALNGALADQTSLIVEDPSPLVAILATPWLQGKRKFHTLSVYRGGCPLSMALDYVQRCWWGKGFMSNDMQLAFKTPEC